MGVGFQFLGYCYLKFFYDSGRRKGPPCIAKFLWPFVTVMYYDGLGCSFVLSLMFGFLYTLCCWSPKSDKFETGPSFFVMLLDKTGISVIYSFGQPPGPSTVHMR